MPVPALPASDHCADPTVRDPPANATSLAHRQAAQRLRLTAPVCQEGRHTRALRHLAVLHELVADKLDGLYPEPSAPAAAACRDESADP